MELEININDITISGKSSAFIIVDMQNDFVHPNGKLFSSNAQKIILPIKLLIDKARQSNVKIIYTQDTHFHDDPVEFPIWGEHVIKGSWGWQIIDELKPQTHDIVIEKLRYDAFFGTPLEHILKIYRIETVIVAGTVANICVLHTVSSARLHNYNVIVPVDSISALTEFDYSLTLRQMDFLYKVKFTNAELIQFQSN
ncbi:MAG: cysteine hydrolase family protein [Candidatus Hydrogenedens sp.]